MATTKKSAKKSPARAKAASTRAKSTTARKSSAAKRAPAKSRSSTNVRRKAAPTALQSFRRSQPEQPFMSTSVTVQTFYWVILGALVVGLAMWTLTLHNQIQDIYDEIDRNQAAEQQLDIRATK